MAWLVASALAALAAWLLPWRLDDRLRCVAAYEATVGPLGEEERLLGERSSWSTGVDPWGRPFQLFRVRFTADSTLHGTSFACAFSPGPDGQPQLGQGDDLVLPRTRDDLALQCARAAPLLAVKLVTGLLFAAWCVWSFSPLWPRAALLIAPLLVGLIGSILAMFLSLGFQIAPPTTPLLGPHAVFASSWFAGLVATLLLAQARARRDESARAP